jgi:hypothetical protein
MAPSVGQIVHYVLQSGGCRAAIVVGIADDKRPMTTTTPPATPMCLQFSPKAGRLCNGCGDELTGYTQNMQPTIGRIVHYVMPTGAHRPAIIVEISEDGRPHLQIFTDGSNDAPRLIVAPPAVRTRARQGSASRDLALA